MGEGGREGRAGLYPWERRREAVSVDQEVGWRAEEAVCGRQAETQARYLDSPWGQMDRICQQVPEVSLVLSKVLTKPLVLLLHSPQQDWE